MSVKKRIVLPIYNDRYNTFGWERRYLATANKWERRYLPAQDISLVIYEKDDSLVFGQEVETPEGFKIPNIGRSNFAFLHHICKHYDELADVEIFAKTHVARQQILIHESIKMCDQYDHLQFWNSKRVMIFPSSEVFERLQDYWIENCSPHRVGSGCIEIRECSVEKLRLNEYFDDSMINSPCAVLQHIFIYVPPLYYRGDNVKCFYEIFPDYVWPEVHFLRQEDVWSVKKHVIRYHPREFYVDLLNKVVSDKNWQFHRDGWCWFWPTFWEETIRQAKQAENRND